MPLVKIFFRIFSYLFHPVFLSVYFIAYALWLSPNSVFNLKEANHLKWFLIVAYTNVFFPLLVVFLLKQLGFLKSLTMQTKEERYVPLIASMLFNFWVFWVFHASLHANIWLQLILLATFVCTVLCFLFTIFDKVSLHTAGISSIFFCAVVLNILTSFQDYFLLIISLVLTIIMIYCRWYLHAHNKAQIQKGLFIGFITALITFISYFILS